MKWKALSVVAPWGQKIADGIKTIEVRSWTTNEIGPEDDLLIVENKNYLMNDGESDPDGRAVALVKVLAIRPFVRDDLKASCASAFEEGYFSWVLGDVRKLRRDMRVLAARKIYEVEIEEKLI